jgi:glucosylceramidase
LFYTNSYYYIGHFSRFIRPGAKRIMVAPSRSMLLATGFVNEDGSVVVVVMNQHDDAGQYALTVGREAVEIDAPAHSIQTVVFRAAD